MTFSGEDKAHVCELINSLCLIGRSPRADFEGGRVSTRKFRRMGGGMKEGLGSPLGVIEFLLSRFIMDQLSAFFVI